MKGKDEGKIVAKVRRNNAEIYLTRFKRLTVGTMSVSSQRW